MHPSGNGCPLTAPPYLTRPVVAVTAGDMSGVDIDPTHPGSVEGRAAAARAAIDWRLAP